MSGNQMVRGEKKMMADQRAMEEQMERTNPLDGRGATPSMGLSQVRGGMRGGIVRGDEVGNPFAHGNALMEHLHKLHGGAYAKAFHRGMEGMGSGRYEGEGMGMEGAGWWDDFKKGFNMVFEPAAKVLKVVSGLVGQPAIGVGLSALGYGKIQRMGDKMLGCGQITQKEREALQSVLDKHPMKGGRMLDMARLGKVSMPLVDNMMGMGLPKKHRDGFAVMVEAMKKAKKGGPAVGGKKMMMESESDSEDEPFREEGGRSEMPPLYEAKRKNYPVNRDGMDGGKHKRSAGASDGRRRRAEIVRKVMKEEGVGMIEASKLVKSRNLF